MQQTLFSIPHSCFEGPLLIGWLVLGVLLLAWQGMRHGWKEAAANWGPIVAIGAAVIWFVLPRVEVLGVDPQNPLGPLVKNGLAIRGYGVFMVLGIASGAGLVLARCRRIGADPDTVLSLLFWMIACGLIGARLFYVIQKHDEFFGNGLPLGQALLAMVDMTKGGLVVYGSLIGSVLAAVVFFRFNDLSFRSVADILAPGMAIGLAFGRLGCLMNGCCFGGVCAPDLPALHFPAGSPPYMRQLEEGTLLGLNTTRADVDLEASPAEQNAMPYRLKVESIEAGSLADMLPIEPGQGINIYVPDSLRVRHFKSKRETIPDDQQISVVLETPGPETMQVPLYRLPTASLGVHPTQVYSAITAALLCATLWFYWPVRSADGEVFALMLILYPIARFLMESIRRDELGQFGTEFTISQWVSLFMVLIGFALFAWYRSSGQRLSSVAALAA